MKRAHLHASKLTSWSLRDSIGSGNQARWMSFFFLLGLFAALEQPPTFEHLDETWSAPASCGDWREHLNAEVWPSDPELQRCDAELRAVVVPDGNGVRLIVLHSDHPGIPPSSWFRHCDDALDFLDIILRFNCTQTRPERLTGWIGVGGSSGLAVGALAPRREGSVGVSAVAELRMSLALPRARVELFTQMQSPTAATTNSIPGRFPGLLEADFFPALAGARTCLEPVAMAHHGDRSREHPKLELPICAEVAAGAVVARGLPVELGQGETPPIDPSWASYPWAGAGGAVGLRWRPYDRIELLARVEGLASLVRVRPEEPKFDLDYPRVGPGTVRLVLGLEVPVQDVPLRHHAPGR